MCSALLHSLRYVVLVVTIFNPNLELLKMGSYLSSFALLRNLLRDKLELKLIQTPFLRTVTTKEVFHSHSYFVIVPNHQQFIVQTF